jgi:predicted enzyme related to lactoylglutathione lyase
LSAGISFYQQLFGWEKKDEMDMGDMGKYYMFGRDRSTSTEPFTPKRTARVFSKARSR